MKLFLFLILLFSGCGQSDVKKTKPHIAPVCISPIHLSPIDRIKSDSIFGTDRQEIFSYVQEFPNHKYQMVGVNCPYGIGYFCVDEIPDYIKTQIRSGHSWEAYTSSQILQFAKPGTTVVDIGAHIGTQTLAMSRSVGPSGKVIAFEPQPKTFRELLVNMSLNDANNIIYYWAGAGNKKEKLKLLDLNPDNEGASGFGGTGKEVEIIPLDSLNLTNVSLIKIDVEGMELEVLEGAKETIKINQPVMIVEICGGIIPEKASIEEKKEVLRRIHLIEDMGYEVVRINDFWDYLALPKNSDALRKTSQTKLFRHGKKNQAKWEKTTHLLPSR